MQIHWTYDDCDDQDEARIERHWEDVQIELEGKIAELSDAPTELRIAVLQDDSSPQWEMQAALHLPGNTLVAEGRAESPEEALNLMLHGLAEEIDRLEEAAVRDGQHRRRFKDVVPLLAKCREQRRSEAFMSHLVPVVQSLGRYVQRELQVRENEESLVGEEITAADVLDETLVQAWEQFNGRKPDLRLDLWLVQLAEQAIERLSAPVADQSIDDEQPAPTNESRESDRDEWIEQVSYPETIELSELVADATWLAAWDDLDMEAKQAQLAEMLGRLPWEQRQAFVLNLAHGFNTAEIADFQDRSVAEVEDDVAEAIQKVRTYLAEERAMDIEEPPANV